MLPNHSAASPLEIEALNPMATCHASRLPCNEAFYPVVVPYRSETLQEQAHAGGSAVQETGPVHRKCD